MLIRTERFNKRFKELPKEIRELMIRKLELLIINPRHPSLRVKKIKGEIEGYKGVFEASMIKCQVKFCLRN